MITIEDIREKSKAVFNRYPVKKVSVFGSYAKGDQTKESDIDFLIKDSNISLLELSGLKQLLSETFNTSVDLVCENDLSDIFKFLIRDDEVMIYEK